MDPLSLRRALYLGTRDLHDRLDAAVGALNHRDDYLRYLTGSYEFRAAIEPDLRVAGWEGETLLPALRQDLSDLDQPVPTRRADLPAMTPALRVAALYVTEGSALGARLLVRRAQDLGYGADHGARHLAQQTASRDRWPSFLTWLEAQELPHEAVVEAAREIFAVALSAYRVEA